MGWKNLRESTFGFVDSDDWVENDMYERLLSNMLENDSDIAICGLIKGNKYFKQSKWKAGVYEAYELYPTIINNGKFIERGIIPSRVVKLFKKDIVDKTLKYCLENISLGEDIVMSFSAILFSKKVSFIENYFPYHYRINPKSITHSFSPQMFGQLKLFNEQLRTISHIRKDYDFTKQIDSDFIGNTINIIESALLSDYPKNECLTFLKEIINDSNVKSIINFINVKKWGIRYKIYYILLLKKRIYSIYIYGKILKVLRMIKAD